MLLTDPLNFSGGDFFPAILQDSKRVTILGSKTAGAGGYVKAARIPNRLGVSDFTYTGSIALRVDQNPIENLGVTPDIPYSISKKDYQDDYSDYKKKILKTIHEMIETEKSK